MYLQKMISKESGDRSRHILGSQIEPEQQLRSTKHDSRDARLLEQNGLDLAGSWLRVQIILRNLSSCGHMANKRSR